MLHSITSFNITQPKSTFQDIHTFTHRYEFWMYVLRLTLGHLLYSTALPPSFTSFHLRTRTLFCSSQHALFFWPVHTNTTNNTTNPLYPPQLPLSLLSPQITTSSANNLIQGEYSVFLSLVSCVCLSSIFATANTSFERPGCRERFQGYYKRVVDVL